MCVLLEEVILCFDVAVDDTARVAVLKSQCALQHDISDVILVNLSLNDEVV